MDGLISTVILIINTLPFVVSQPGFISIDCGATEDHFNNVTKIHWTNDNVYSKIGESSTLSIGDPLFTDKFSEVLTVRSFPRGKKNCYEINTTDNTKYLLRLCLLDANSGQDHSMYVIIDDATIRKLNPPHHFYEFIFTAVSNVTSVCFGRVYGDPFVNSIELRELKQTMYPLADRRTILSIEHRNAVKFVNSENDEIIRHPDDKYDRFWVPRQFFFVNETSGKTSCFENRGDEVPPAVMRNGVESDDGSIKRHGTIDGYEIALTFFFADFAKQGDWRIRITVTSDTLDDDKEVYQNDTEVSSGKCNFSTIKNEFIDNFRKKTYDFIVQSAIPPPLDNSSDFGEHFQLERPRKQRISAPAILNAWHASSLHYRAKKVTNTTEFAIMKRIREHFNITKWTGDPCLPVNFTWDKVECDYDGPNATVKSVDLSGMKLHNTVPDLFTNLTSLSKLDLSDNDLFGELPDTLFENHLLKVDYNNNPKLRRKVHGLTTTQRNILIGIVVPVGIIALFVGFLACRHFRGKTPEEYTKDTTETQGGESTETSKWRVPWSSPIMEKDPTQS